MKDKIIKSSDNNIEIDLDYKILSATKDMQEKIIEEYINKIIKVALELENIHGKNIYVSIKSASKEEIHKLNLEYRGVDSETDVLSFPIFSKDEINSTKLNEIELGDMVICLDVVSEHSIEYGTGIKRELLYMITHSICHLLGYDHIEEQDKKLMRKREEEILNIVGVSKDE